MNMFVKILVVFDLLCFGVYFGGDILSSALDKLRKKTVRKEPYEFYEIEEDADVPLSIDSIGKKLHKGLQDEWEDEEYEAGDC